MVPGGSDRQRRTCSSRKVQPQVTNQQSPGAWRRAIRASWPFALLRRTLPVRVRPSPSTTPSRPIAALTRVWQRGSSGICQSGSSLQFPSHRPVVPLAHGGESRSRDQRLNSPSFKLYGRHGSVGWRGGFCAAVIVLHYWTPTSTGHTDTVLCANVSSASASIRHLSATIRTRRGNFRFYGSSFLSQRAPLQRKKRFLSMGCTTRTSCFPTGRDTP